MYLTCHSSVEKLSLARSPLKILLYPVQVLTIELQVTMNLRETAVYIHIVCSFQVKRLLAQDLSRELFPREIAVPFLRAHQRLESFSWGKSAA
jgi:hypothetical protein